jgi:hypothetical protein
MNQEKKPPKTVEVSLGYISWSLKEIAEELKKLTEILGKSKNIVENEERFF